MSTPTAQFLEQITEAAQSLAATLGLEVLAVSYKTHAHPPVLRIDIRHQEHPTGIDDCAQFSRLLESYLDTLEGFEHLYSLEVSSPGIDRKLTTEREFAAFRGFPVRVTGYGPIQGKKVWEGTLLKRDETTVQITLQGRIVSLPWAEVASVQLAQ
ncbi:ribosome maturation factor RimP [Anthocerotibacter panamensis]|uniref:ribosome maturation factor RimP n=1 Tax=Anthocerotibacter panamensis TaxID=2857077 RepID=UPI001C401AF4|nr:ribosome maturation factor RimP [Anthocerotibacter panamensis]